MRQIPTTGRGRARVRRRGAVHEGLTPPREPISPMPPPRSDWRSEVIGLGALSVIAGISG